MPHAQGDVKLLENYQGVFLHVISSFSRLSIKNFLFTPFIPILEPELRHPFPFKFAGTDRVLSRDIEHKYTLKYQIFSAPF